MTTVNKGFASKDFVVRDTHELEEMVLYDKVPEKKLAYITFNNPKQMNAMPWPAFERMKELVYAAERDPEVKVIIFKGNGDHLGVGDNAWEPGFVIGVQPGRTDEERKRPNIRRRLVGPDREGQKWMGMRGGGNVAVGLDCIKPIIVQCHGYCYGLPFMLLLYADIVIASEDALFTHPWWRYIGGLINWSLLIELVGLRKAQEMVLTCRPLDAREAEKCGLITKVVPRDKLEQTVLEYAQVISVLPGDGVAVSKQMCQLSLMARGLDIGAQSQTIGHGWASHMQFDPDEWNFLKERRDKGIAGAVAMRDQCVPPQYRLSMKARKESK